MAPALCSFALLRSSLFSAIFRLFSLARVIGRDRNDRISTAFLPFVVPFDISLYRRRTRILRALFPSGPSGSTRSLPRYRLRNTIKLFLATTRSRGTA